MKILFVSAYVPSRIRVRPYNFIKALTRCGHQITLVCGATANDNKALDELYRICDRVVTVESGTFQTALNVLRALPGLLPLQTALSFGTPLLEAVQNEVQNQQYDVAHVDHLRATALADKLYPLPTVLDAIDSMSLVFERTLRNNPDTYRRALALADLARTRRYEGHYVQYYDQVLVASAEDAWALTELAVKKDKSQVAANIHVIPNGVDLDYFQPQVTQRLPHTLVFSGNMNYYANMVSALFLAREIMPLVWAHRPEVQLNIVGNAPSREIQALRADPRITVTGYVEDVRSYLSQATLAVSPLRYGVGIQNNVLEALAMGTPLIAARQAAQALQVEEGAELLLAQEATEYAEAILALLDDAPLRTLLGRAGRRYVERYHDWDKAAAQLERLYTITQAEQERCVGEVLAS